MDLELHIEELVLYGLRSQQGHALAAALEQELLRLFEEEGLPPALQRGQDLPPIGALAVEFQPGAGPEMLGRQVAQSVFGVFHE